jgi:serine/threonine-protein kinase
VPWIVAIVIVLTVALAGAALAQVSSAQPISIPGLTGLSIAKATEQAKAAGLEVALGTARAAPDPKGTVIDQSPKAGAFTGQHKVTLITSAGPPNVDVPNVINAPWDDAKKALDTAGLLYTVGPPQSSETIGAGRVLSVKPDRGTSVPPDQTVAIVLSSGHAPVPVPAVAGDTFGDAVKLLQAKKFKVKRAPQDSFSPTVKKGDVIDTEPPALAPAPYGSTVVVHVSKGPDLVAVPDVTFETLRNARLDLRDHGLVVGTVANDSGEDGVVMSQNPAGGKLPRGSSVDLVLRKTNRGLFSGLFSGLLGGLD